MRTSSQAIAVSGPEDAGFRKMHVLQIYLSEVTPIVGDVAEAHAKILFFNTPVFRMFF
jgi:hypothetical protein